MSKLDSYADWNVGKKSCVVIFTNRDGETYYCKPVLVGPIVKVVRIPQKTPKTKKWFMRPWKIVRAELNLEWMVRTRTIAALFRKPEMLVPAGSPTFGVVLNVELERRLRYHWDSRFERTKDFVTVTTPGGETFTISRRPEDLETFHRIKDELFSTPPG